LQPGYESIATATECVLGTTCHPWEITGISVPANKDLTRLGRSGGCHGNNIGAIDIATAQIRGLLQPGQGRIQHGHESIEAPGQLGLCAADRAGPASPARRRRATGTDTGEIG